MSPTEAVSSPALSIPLIDFSAFLSPSATPASKLSTAQALLDGFQNAGFVYLSNHGIAKPDIAQTFAESARFFARDQAEKESMSWTTPEANRGYSRPGLEKTTDLTDAAAIAAQRDLEGADLKESLEIGREGVPGMPNHWPAGDEKFKAQMLEFFARCAELHAEVLRALALALRLPDPGWFDQYCDQADNTLRLLHYPRVKRDVFKTGAIRAGAHTDYGSLTLLFQDMAGGLQVLSPSGEFVDATPVPDTIVVNAGDLLARWSNDTIRSTKHRVVQPPVGGEGEWCDARYSIAYFCNPNFDSYIDAIPGTYEEGAKKYQGINSGDYLVQRLTATY